LNWNSLFLFQQPINDRSPAEHLVLWNNRFTRILQSKHAHRKPKH
jgi:hypothetical protein